MRGKYRIGFSFRPFPPAGRIHEIIDSWGFDFVLLTHGGCLIVPSWWTCCCTEVASGKYASAPACAHMGYLSADGLVLDSVGFFVRVSVRASVMWLIYLMFYHDNNSPKACRYGGQVVSKGEEDIICGLGRIHHVNCS